MVPPPNAVKRSALVMGVPWESSIILAGSSLPRPILEPGMPKKSRLSAVAESTPESPNG
jgi:hypothetical protein